MLLQIFLLHGYGQITAGLTVNGMVTDVHGAVIANAVVHFSDGSRIFSAKTSPAGEYSTVLNPGEYSVSVAPSTQGFQSLRRSSIRVQVGPPRSLNFELSGLFAVLDNPLPGSTGMADHPIVSYWPYSYDEIPNVAEIGIKNAMIAYAMKCETQSSIIYKVEPFDRSAGAKVTFTYDFYKVTAEAFIYDKRSRSFTTSGEVTFEDGQRKRVFPSGIGFTIGDGKVLVTPFSQKGTEEDE